MEKSCPFEEAGGVILYILEFYSDFVYLGVDTYLLKNQSLSGKNSSLNLHIL